MFNLNSIFAQTAQPGSSSFLVSILPIILIFVVFYFLVSIPQKKQQKKHQEMMQNLQKGDEVITSSGIYGTIVGVKEDSVTVKVDDNTTIRFSKNAILQKIVK